MTSEDLTRMKRLKVNKADNFNLGVNEDELRSLLTNDE